LVTCGAWFIHDTQVPIGLFQLGIQLKNWSMTARLLLQDSVPTRSSGHLGS